jgi:hypothetical protein
LNSVIAIFARDGGRFRVAFDLSRNGDNGYKNRREMQFGR